MFTTKQQNLSRILQANTKARNLARILQGDAPKARRSVSPKTSKAPKVLTEAQLLKRRLLQAYLHSDVETQAKVEAPSVVVSAVVSETRVRSVRGRRSRQVRGNRARNRRRMEARVCA